MKKRLNSADKEEAKGVALAIEQYLKRTKDQGLSKEEAIALLADAMAEALEGAPYRAALVEALQKYVSRRSSQPKS